MPIAAAKPLWSKRTGVERVFNLNLQHPLVLKKEGAFGAVERLTASVGDSHTYFDFSVRGKKQLGGKPLPETKGYQLIVPHHPRHGEVQLIGSPQGRAWAQKIRDMAMHLPEGVKQKELILRALGRHLAEK
ncbi:MAG: hypothetical protein WC792_02040 [Candidatus Micrarchaeia archaeon]|jgi:hypothetical protein